jgi:phosphoesterase RecJ-like protein
MANTRTARISSEYMQALCASMRTLKDPRVQGFVSVTRCEVTNDLRYAKVYISVLGDERAERDAMKGLKSAAGYLRRDVAGRVGLRAAPEPVFHLDDSIRHGAEILSVINDIENAPPPPPVTVRYTAEEAANFLKEHDNYLIITHRRPDGDTLGSASALCLALRGIGKTAFLFDNPETTPKYGFLSEGLTIGADFAPESVLSVDIADAALFPEGAKLYANRIDLSIDHHDSSRAFSRALWCNSAAAATGEMVLRMVDLLGAELDERIANNLYTAIATDTGCFKFSNVSAETFTAAARCTAAGANIAELNLELFIKKSPNRLRLEGEVQANMEFFEGGKIALVKISRDLIRELSVSIDDLDGIAAIPRNVEGVEIGITVTEQDDACKVSVRTSRGTNAAEVCIPFGGGGHRAAAGCTVNEEIDKAGELLVASAKNILNKEV